MTETYSESCQTSKMELLAKMVDGFQQLTFFEKSSTLNVGQGSEDPSDDNLILQTNVANKFYYNTV